MTLKIRITTQEEEDELVYGLDKVIHASGEINTTTLRVLLAMYKAILEERNGQTL